MVTIMLALTVGLIALTITPLIGPWRAHHGSPHRTDLMAGDEGED